MNRVKLIFQHTMMITFGIVVGISIQGIIYRYVLDSDLSLTWYQPLSFIISGLLCSLPSLLLVSERELPRKQYHIRIALHCICMFIIVMALGYVFHWYRTTVEAIFVACEFCLVYGFVWAGSGWLGMLDERDINKALNGIRDEE